MKVRRLGDNGPIVSAIGLGCMRMSNIMGGDQPLAGSDRDAESLATIGAALDAGVTFLNTADFYGMGHNEALIARALRGRRDHAFLSVKAGILRNVDGAILGMDGRPNAIKTYAAYSLQRLGVDYIDLYQPARHDPTVPYEETIGAVADLIKEGKVRYLGVSEVSAELLRKANAIHPVTALEIEYSLAERFAEREILGVARELGIGIAAYGVVTQGLLAGEMKSGVKDAKLAASFRRFQAESLQKNLETVTFLEDLARAKACTPAQLAVAWMLTRGEDTVAVIGMSRRSHLGENLKALEIVISKNELDLLDRVFQAGAIVGSRP